MAASGRLRIDEPDWYYDAANRCAVTARPSAYLSPSGFSLTRHLIGNASSRSAGPSWRSSGWSAHRRPDRPRVSSCSSASPIRMATSNSSGWPTRSSAFASSRMTTDKMNRSVADVGGSLSGRVAVHALRRRGERAPAELHRRGAAGGRDPALSSDSSQLLRERASRSRRASSARRWRSSW